MFGDLEDIPNSKQFLKRFEPKRKLPGWSPVRAVINGELDPAAIYQRERRKDQTEEDKQSTQQMIYHLNKKYNSNWRPKEVKEYPDDAQTNSTLVKGGVQSDTSKTNVTRRPFSVANSPPSHFDKHATTSHSGMETSPDNLTKGDHESADNYNQVR